MKLKGIDENTAVHCPTEELSEKVLKIAKEAGCSPFLVNSMYCHYEKDTCYNLMNGTFSDIMYYKNIKDYTILPAEEFIKLNTMKQLPEKWAIKRTPENAREINTWYASRRERITELSHSNVYITNDLDFYSCVPNGYEEITIEQWREAVKQDFGGDKVEFKSNATEDSSELEGYEAPYDIGVGFSKGHVVKISNKVDNRYGSYSEIPENGKMWFSAEWVERDWKPVYKAKEKKRVPKSGWVIQVVGGLGIPILDGSTSRPALFNTQADCIEWVKKNGMLEEFYTFLEVDYITEE